MSFQLHKTPEESNERQRLICFSVKVLKIISISCVRKFVIIYGIFGQNWLLVGNVLVTIVTKKCFTHLHWVVQSNDLITFNIVIYSTLFIKAVDTI